MAKNLVVFKNFLNDFGKNFVVSNLTYFLPKRKFFKRFFALLAIKKLYRKWIYHSTLSRVVIFLEFM